MIVGIKNSLLFFITLFGCSFTFAQKKHVSLKDSLDKKFDMSDYLIDANGFIPIPLIITEPAVGGFGGAMIPVFINKNHPYQDSIKGQLVTTHVAPDITGGLALYTVNNTWALAAFRSGILIKSRIKYVIGGAYANINVSFYKTLSQLGEKELKFNLKTMPLLLQATKRIGFSHWYAGLKYLFVKVDASYKGDTILNSVAKSLELDRVVSQLGGIVELDSRDNIFTPDKGIKLHTDAVISDNFLGSDYDFWKLNMYMYAYTPVSKKIVTLRFICFPILLCVEYPHYVTRAIQLFFQRSKCVGILNPAGVLWGFPGQEKHLMIGINLMLLIGYGVMEPVFVI